MSITTYLNKCGFNIFEGHNQEVEDQVLDLIKLTDRENINIMEIGFNAGHSAEIFLKNNSSLRMVSFDIGIYNYVYSAKKYIDLNFPDRHRLILGDSRKTVPIYLNNNIGVKFDFIFIDGGHEYNIAKEDIENCFNLAHKDTIIAVDDTIYTKGWEKNYTIGPTKVWIENLEKNKIIEINRKEYGKGRGMSWGKINL